MREYLAVGRDLPTKVRESLLGLCEQPVSAAHWEALEYLHRMLDKHLDLVERRLLKEEIIPSHEKVFSLFDPDTEWIQKGKRRPDVELGHPFLIATCQHQLIHDYDVPVGELDINQSVPVTDRLLGRYGVGSIAGISFDKGFTRAADRELLSLYIPTVVMPKRGKKNTAETARESGKEFVALRQAHSAVESEQQPGTSWAQPMPGHGAGWVFEIRGLRRDELQPARDRTRVAGAAMGASPAGAFGGLKPPNLKPPIHSDRSGVAEIGK
ncbi:MAG: hypothetical protein EXS31_18845 [Pedosphaera sp.]|nr:hypothetical protein [Pedosphaera sp.]